MAHYLRNGLLGVELRPRRSPTGRSGRRARCSGEWGTSRFVMLEFALAILEELKGVCKFYLLVSSRGGGWEAKNGKVMVLEGIVVS